MNYEGSDYNVETRTNVTKSGARGSRAQRIEKSVRCSGRGLGFGEVQLRECGGFHHGKGEQCDKKDDKRIRRNVLRQQRAVFRQMAGGAPRKIKGLPPTTAAPAEIKPANTRKMVIPKAVYGVPAYWEEKAA